MCGELLFGADEVEEGTASCVETPSIGVQESSSEKGGALEDDGVSKNPAESRETKRLAQRKRKKERQRAKKLAARGGKKEAEPTKDEGSRQEVEMVLQGAIDMVVSSQQASLQVEGPQVGHNQVGHNEPCGQVAAAGAPRGGGSMDAQSSGEEVTGATEGDTLAVGAGSADEGGWEPARSCRRGGGRGRGRGRGADSRRGGAGRGKCGTGQPGGGDEGVRRRRATISFADIF